MEYPDCFIIIEEKVKPERLSKQKNATDRDRAKKWWRYGRSAPELYRTIAGMERVLVTGEVSKFVNVAFRPASDIFSHMLIVFPLSSGKDFALVQSCIHEV